MSKNIDSSKGSRVSGRTGPLRSPAAGFLVATPKLHPKTAANTTMPGISKRSAPIRTPSNNGKIVRY